MGLDFITRKRSTVCVTVAHKPRRFTLRAHSIADHLMMLECQERAQKEALAAAKDASPAQAARAEMTALLALVIPLLQEPSDGGMPLVEDDGWLLGLGDPERVLRIQRELTGLETALGTAKPSKEKAPSAERVAFEWLDIATTITRAGLAPTPHTALNDWSIAQCVETYHRACRELWRDVNLRVQLAGGKGEKEKNFQSPREKAANSKSKPKGDRKSFQDSINAFMSQNSAEKASR